MPLQCLSEESQFIFEAGSVLDYCNMTLRLPRLSAFPPVINVADSDGANDVHVPETGDAGLSPKAMAVRDVFPVREDTRSSQISLEWKKGRNLFLFQSTLRYISLCMPQKRNGGGGSCNDFYSMKLLANRFSIQIQLQSVWKKRGRSSIYVMGEDIGNKQKNS